MSRPPSFVPPPGTVRTELRTARGSFAALLAEPSGAPAGATALLLPGFTGSKEDFLPLLPLLSAGGYRVWAVDGRGQYESEGPESPEAYARTELARDVSAQAVAAAGGEPVHLLGHSLGGLIARAAVLLDGAAFRSLTLMSSGPAAVSAPQVERIGLLSGALRTMDKAAVWEALRAMEDPGDVAKELGRPAAGEPAELDVALRERWMRTRTQQLLSTGELLAGEPDRVAELVASGTASLVVSGEQDDVWPVPWLDEMARRLGAERAEIAGAGHSPNTDRPQATAAALLSFWDRIPAPLPRP